MTRLLTSAVDAAERLERLDPGEAARELVDEDDAYVAEVFEEMVDFARPEIFLHLPVERAASILRLMVPDEASDLLSQLEPSYSRRLLGLLPPEDAKTLSSLLLYPPDSAGGIMTTEFVSLTADQTVDEAIAKLRESAAGDVETIYYVYVTNPEGRLAGVLSLRDLFLSPGNRLLGDIMTTDPIKVEAGADQEEAADLLGRYHLLALPVVDRDDRLLGIVTMDDALEVLEDEATEDILKRGAVSASDVDALRSARLLASPVKDILGMRLPWLMFVLVGGLLAAGVIGQFEDVLQSVVVLAFFIPVVMDMGGNVGTQSATIFVRGAILGQIEPGRVGHYIAKEVTVGLAIGLVTGAAAGVAAFIWQRNLVVGLVVFLAMTLTCTLASTIGYLIPWLLDRMGFDPAAAANPLITTVKDVTGLLIYFGLATVLLRALL
ncbi:MAG: magnesium transporter [Bacillota bacterium]